MIKKLRYSVVGAKQKADVLRTNPDHVVIALEFKAKLMNAFCVIAKGLFKDTGVGCANKAYSKRKWSCNCRK
jgi:flagellar biosynthesis protein FlhB